MSGECCITSVCCGQREGWGQTVRQSVAIPLERGGRNGGTEKFRGKTESLSHPQEVQQLSHHIPARDLSLAARSSESPWGTCVNSPRGQASLRPDLTSRSDPTYLLTELCDLEEFIRSIQFCL